MQHNNLYMFCLCNISVLKKKRERKKEYSSSGCVAPQQKGQTPVISNQWMSLWCRLSIFLFDGAGLVDEKQESNDALCTEAQTQHQLA